MAAISLARPLRNALQAAVMRGREIAEAGAADALAFYAVGDAKAPGHLDEQQRAFRNRLRAHGRQLGDARESNGRQEVRRLMEEVAYEQWHRILFTRFLVENDLLIHPEFEAPLPLAYVEELAREAGKDTWELASEYASRMLPQIFRPDDPTLQLRLPKNRLQELERLVLGLDQQTFKASDSLGWTYQFWQAKRKDDINASGVKIGAEELPAVTQLFTEDYMVEFLLHNSLGAWWVSNHPDKPLPVDMPYLRLVEEEVDGEKRQVPAAGRFEGWPKHLKDFKALDPCCGSGHFPVFLLHLLVPMRMALEGLSAADAVSAVLRENIHGLELDPRCVEIAVFALALAAWTYPGTGGYRRLPNMNIACCGMPITQKESEWVALANGDERLREGMRALYRTFKDAPTLGSLIDPRATGDLLGARFEELSPVLVAALEKDRIRSSEDATEAMLTANGLLPAARLLSERYALVITNTPYLGRGNQCEKLKAFCEAHYPDAKQDLANVMLERCLKLANVGGVVQFVMPQNWLFLTSYKKQRMSLLKAVQWNLLARLGEGGFDSPQAAGAFVVLLTQSTAPVSKDFKIRGVDASGPRVGQEKAAVLREGVVLCVDQLGQLENPDGRIALQAMQRGERLLSVADYHNGIQTGDFPRFGRCVWECPAGGSIWSYHQSTVDSTQPFGGMSYLLRWEGGGGEFYKFLVERLGENGVVAWRRGLEAHGKKGVCVSGMRSLPATLYTGTLFDNNLTVLTCDSADTCAIWAYIESQDYSQAVRTLNQKVSVTDSSFVDVPFERAHWQAVAADRYPNGLPEPYSNDPTQWIFHGHPAGSVIWHEASKRTAHGGLRSDGSVLHVATARLLGHRWPAELDVAIEVADEQREWVKRCDVLLSLAAQHGIVCIPPVKGEKPAADRLLAMLASAYGNEWKPQTLDALLESAGCKGESLEDWLRNDFFPQHCKLFLDRPFIWQVWDGERDGFSALVNYHKLDKQTLSTLTYTYLGAWIDEKKREAGAGVDGAKELADAAKALQDKLKLILDGEAPYDIFVRWKPLAEQPMGWEPDINDGVRINIRPFMTVGDVGKRGAGILRDKPNIHWKKDRGTDPTTAPWYELGPKYGEDKGARINDHHTTLEEKRKARGAKK